MKVFGLIAAFALIIIGDFMTIANKTNRIRYIAVCGFIFLLSLIVSLLLVTGKAPISPARLIENIVKGMSGGM